MVAKVLARGDLPGDLNVRESQQCNGGAISTLLTEPAWPAF